MADSKHVRDSLFVAVAAAGLLLLLALLSYSPFDPTVRFFAGYPVNEFPRNLVGRFGSYPAGILLNVFGWSAYLLPLLSFFFAVRIYRALPFNPARKALLCLALMSACSVAAALPPNGAANRLLFPHGGILGLFLAAAGRHFLGVTGAAVVAGAAVLIFASLTMEISVLELPGAAVKSLRALAGKTGRKRDKTRETPVKREKSAPAAAAPEPEPEPVPPGAFNLPALSLLADPKVENRAAPDLERYKNVIRDTIADFDIAVEVTECNQGPTVTMFELALPPGVMPQRITALSDNLAMALRATSVRVVAPLPGKSTVGVEVPNPELDTVYLAQILSAPEFRQQKSKLTLALGKDTLGRPLTADLRRMPHLLVAGFTGSGKTVCLNSLLLSILFQSTPEDVQLLLIDPKKVEFTPYEKIPHLLFPVITEPRDAIDALKWMVGEMDRRYRLFQQHSVRSIDIYNSGGRERIPYIVVVLDELADLITVARTEVESNITRLSQLARSAGIHLILATQRPSVNVITGVIKANLPARIAFQVSSATDSRTILDRIGAEKLLGRGDMLYFSSAAMQPVRAQGCYLEEPEIESVCNFWRGQAQGPTYDFEHLRENPDQEAFTEETDDALYDEAVKIVHANRSASISLIQRRLKIGFNRAARLIEEMEERGIVGPHEEGKPRKILR